MSKRAPHTHTEICENGSDLSTIHRTAAVTTKKKRQIKRKAKLFVFHPVFGAVLFCLYIFICGWIGSNAIMEYDTTHNRFVLFYFLLFGIWLGFEQKIGDMFYTKNSIDHFIDIFVENVKL